MAKLRVSGLYLGLLIIVACVIGVIGQPYTYVPADRNQTAGVRGGDVKILPTTYLREYDPITVFFGKEAVVGNVGPIEPPTQLFTITPAHPGEYIKIDSRTLEFRPTVPWRPLQKYKFVSGKTHRELTTLLPVPQSVYPELSNNTNLEPINRVGLGFLSKVDPQALFRLVSFDVCALPGVDESGCRTLRATEYSIKESVKGAAEYIYWFTFNEPIGYGQKVKLNLKLSDRAEYQEALRVYSFETKPDFAVNGAGSGGRLLTFGASGTAYDARQAIKLDSEKALIIEFSAPVADPGLSVVKNMVSISPAPLEFGYSVNRNVIVISLEVEQEKLYKVTLNPSPLKDLAGRRLTNKKPSSFYTYLPKLTPFARWGSGFGVVERFGPQHFPIKTQGVSALDFRVYKIDPTHKAFSQFWPRSPVTVSETQRPPGPGEEPVSGYENELHIRMLGSPHYTTVTDLDKEGVNKYQSIDLSPMFASISGKDKPGTYIVGFRLLDGSTYRQYIRVDVTDLCLSSIEAKDRVLFAVTSFTSGKAVSDATVKIVGEVGDVTTVLAQGKSGSDGIFALAHTPEVEKTFKKAKITRVEVSKGDDVLVLAVRTNAYGFGYNAMRMFANNHWRSSGSGYDAYEWLQWLKRTRYSKESDKKLHGFMRTERPIYRPEDSIFIKGYIRETAYGAINLPPAGAHYKITARGPSGARVDYPITLNEFGAFDLKIVPHEPATGDFWLHLLYGADSTSRNSRGSSGYNDIAITDFAVEAYKIPRFEVKIGGVDRISNDAPAEVRLLAAYYAGGRLVGRDVAWKVTSFPYDHRPHGFADYILSSDGRYGAVATERRQSVYEENVKTDDNGSARVILSPQAATAGNPVKYMVEATVTDADKQTVTARRAIIALPSFVLAMQANRHITSGSSITAKVAAIGVNDSLMAGQKVTVELKRVSWTSYLTESDFSRGKPKYITDESIETVEEKSVQTGSAPVAVEFKDQRPGVYILEISSRDRLGRLQSVKVDLYLAGSATQTWKKTEQSVFETVTDRNSYEPGQQAKILLKSPYKKALALAIAEKPNGDIFYKWVEINDGQGAFTLDIKQEMAPKIPVSFLLMRPRVSQPRRAAGVAQADAGKPETVGNTTWLTVNPVANMLNVRLTHAPTVMPNAVLDVTVSLKDNLGKPRSGEVALWLVDEAVLSLRKENTLDPMGAFLEEVNSNITLRDSRNLALGALNISENPGGDGGGDFDEDDLGKITVRKNFKTTPYWNPSIKVDKSGIATVKVPMSSDLTNYSVRAMAISGSDKFGAAKSRVSVRLPVTIQPALPRFARIGDKIRAGGVARVTEGAGGAAIWSVSAKGLSIKGAQNGKITLDNVLPAPLFVDFNVETPPFTPEGSLKWDSVSIKMSVMRNSDKVGDAFEVSIPLLPDRQFIEEAHFVQIDKDKNFSWKALSEAPRENTVLSNLFISDNQYLPKIVSAMSALAAYPYGCTEQVVSQTYPLIVYDGLWRKYGIKPPNSSLAASVNETIEFLKSAQHSDGFFGYWPGTSDYVYLTAYVVDFLTYVKRINDEATASKIKPPFEFDSKMYATAIEALKRSLRSDYSKFLSGHIAYERTCALAALAKSGHTDIGYARELAAASRELDVQGMANIYKSIAHKQDALGSEYAALEKRLWATTIFIDRQGREAFAGFQQNGKRLSARTHSNDAVALASFVNAVSSVQNQSSERSSNDTAQNLNVLRTTLMANELMAMGADDGWGGTYANSMSLLALWEFINKKAPSSKNTFAFNDGDKPQRLTIDGATSKYWLNGKAGDIAYTGLAERTFWGKFSRRYMPQKLGSFAEPEQRGFAVKREIIRVGKNTAAEKISIDKGGSVISFKSGDIVEEHVQVVNPEARLFVAVTVPIAAGFEPLNPNLENSLSEARPANKTTNDGDYQAFYDDRAVYFFERMEQGSYDFYFRTRAVSAGEYSSPPARAEMMYQMSVYGTSAGSGVAIKDVNAPR